MTELGVDQKVHENRGDVTGVKAESITSGAAIGGNATAHRDLVGRDLAGNMVTITQPIDPFNQILLHLVQQRQDFSNLDVKLSTAISNLDEKIDRTKEALRDQIDALRQTHEGLRVGLTAVQADVHGLKTDMNALRLQVDANRMQHELLSNEAKIQRDENRREVSNIREEMKKLNGKIEELSNTTLNTQSQIGSVRFRTQLQLWIVGVGVTVIVVWNLAQEYLSRLSP